MANTLFDKVWNDHVVMEQEDGSTLVHIDRIFLHERTGSAALASIESSGRKIKTPSHVFCTMDHIVDTFPGRTDQTTMPGGSEFIKVTRDLSLKENITLFDLGDARQGISHVVSTEQGIALPGCTMICPDSHTCTLGGIGALATGVGSSECEHALVTETLRFTKPKQMRVIFMGEKQPSVTAKDMILHLIAVYSAAGGSGYAVEFAGPVVEDLEVEARLTLCNMAVEFSAFTGIIAPDEKVFNYLKGRPYAPAGESWAQAMEYWSTLATDQGAHFDREITIDCKDIAPTVTWGTSPQHAISIDGKVPALSSDDADSNHSMEQALIYMGLESGQMIEGLPIQAAFIGSCTNSRLSDLRVAADILKGRKVSTNVRAICVPGSTQVKLAAEKEGLDRIFLDAGFEWRESGCSMCFYAGGEGFISGERVITSTNRNFEGRQGPGCRSHLASPATVAASAVNGSITDVRKLEHLT
ncbi:MAG: 3-isopropylmalate dehydratase large subunit [Porticoccaceae bacterium]|tara:strand:- start:96 stop:1505 length:1410 start_codon:yes stop_codon:yes gene_type:complete